MFILHLFGLMSSCVIAVCSSHLLIGIPGPRCPTESLHTSHKSVCFPSPSHLHLYACYKRQRQMDPNSSLATGRTPQDSFMFEPHWPAGDPAGVPLEVGWNNKCSPAADPHVLKLQISLSLDKHLSSRVTSEKRRCLERRCLEHVQTL